MAIDPELLRAQAAEVARLRSDLPALKRELMGLLEQYQVGRRKAGKIAYTVPTPVLRTLARTLESAVLEDERAAEQLVSAVWSLNRPEAQKLSTWILGQQSGAFVPDLVEQWASQRISVDRLEVLADAGLESWRLANRQEFARRCSAWMDGKYVALALFALNAAVGDGTLTDLPLIFRTLHGLTGTLAGRDRRAFVRLLRSLSIQAPAETAHYLLGEIEQGGSASRRRIRNLLPGLSAGVREALETQGGIMRRVSAREQHINAADEAGKD